MTVARTKIVAGWAAGDADEVVLVAAEFAARLGAHLVIGVVDETRFTTTGRSGHEVVADIDPDGVSEADDGQRVELERHLRTVLDQATATWSIRTTTGTPADGLARIATEVDALMIVIGGGRRTIGRSLRDKFAGSTVEHLAHSRARPVLVVPVDPSGLTADTTDGTPR